MALDSHPERSRLIGRRLGVYHVVSQLGAGGMGEVYRARDTRLGRDVALKVLPRAFTDDPDRLARFEREARALASLNHPNIAAIYGIDDAKPDDGASSTVRALILELVEGETLAERIQKASTTGKRPGLPLPDALAIARQIADALDAAHEKGVVHRDLKPANIKITPDGIVKVLDFGLAKLAPGGNTGESAETTSPTLTSANTRDGIIVGTAAYMSPEQARGLPVDKRTDVWAFGCVLYEMLTGRSAFAGETLTDTLAAVLEREPDSTILPEHTPGGVRRVLLRCLEKNPKRRLRDVADARLELEEAPDVVDRVAAAREPQIARAKWTVIAIAIAVAAGAGGAGWALWSARAPAANADVTRTAIVLPPGTELDTRGGAGPLAVSPDGRRVAYALFGEGRTELHVRSLDEFESKPIAGTGGAQYPFFSPDGEWIAFFADGQLKKVAIRGGSPLTICDAQTVGAGGSRGGTWGEDNTIVFDPGQSGLLRVSADGGRPEPITSRDAAMDKANLSWPQFLPDGRTLLVTTGTPGNAAAELAVLVMADGRWHRLGPGSQAQYAPSGHIVYHAVGVREGELHAVEFDAQNLAFRGMPAAVLENVFRSQDGGGAYFAIAQNGTLIFTQGGYERTLVRVDRNGRRTPIADDRRGFRHPEISPDGSKVAVTIDPRPSQVWVYDIERGTSTPLSTALHNLSPVWAPDGSRVTYSSGGDIFWRPADASSGAELLLKRVRAQYATSWSSDGQLLFFNDNNVGDTYDIWVMPRNGEPRPLIATPADEGSARISPDGRWLAYDSDESGRHEAYVRPFPNVDKGKWTISTNGGFHPVWSRDGREVFYALGSSIYRVPVDTRGETFVSGTPELLFSGAFDLRTTEYSVTHDGEHFIMVESDPNSRPIQIQVVTNWGKEITRLAPLPQQ